MSFHFEWIGVEACAVNIVPGGFDVDAWEVTDDANPERTTEGPSIILSSDAGVVITADSREQLIDFARSLLRMVEVVAG